MKLNQSNCHFLTSGSTEHLWVRVGNEVIWESQYEKLLGLTEDKDLNFDLHLKIGVAVKYRCQEIKKFNITFDNLIY